ncbi:MAG TPA: hypothetical protein PKC03_10130 [Dokdonella sp.]|nr:hypothetical protein [Dokdonella sp.]
MLETLREHFSESELVELVAFMGFMWAGGTFGRIFGIQPGTTNPPEAENHGNIPA